MKIFFILLIVFLFFLPLQIISNTSNLCTSIDVYERAFSLDEFEIITLQISIKNNDASLENTKKISSDIAISKSKSTKSWFKVLTVNKNNSASKD